MKSILISIKPKWVAKILNGEKTIEFRRKFPKDYVGWVYIYCTKDNHQLVKPKDYDKYLIFTKGAVNYSHEQTLNGKVIARFWCDEVLPIIKVVEQCGLYYYTCQTKQFYYNPDKLTFQGCLNTNQIRDYLGDKNGSAIHFSTLKIFDKPKKLNEFKINRFERIKVMDSPYGDLDSVAFHYEKKPILKSLTKAPQNFCYVEVEK